MKLINNPPPLIGPDESATVLNWLTLATKFLQRLTFLVVVIARSRKDLDLEDQNHITARFVQVLQSHALLQ